MVRLALLVGPALAPTCGNAAPISCQQGGSVFPRTFSAPPTATPPPAGAPGATSAPPEATWHRRPTTWRRCRAGGANARERGPILSSELPTAWFSVSWGGSAGALRVTGRHGALPVSL
jgi:hypothetical protein